MHPHIKLLLQCINLEEKEQVQRYSLDQQTPGSASGTSTLKKLKVEGFSHHPVIVTRKSIVDIDSP